MASRKVTSNDTEELRTERGALSHVSTDAAPGEPPKVSDQPGTATTALRDFVRAIARAAAKRDWTAAVHRLEQKEPTDEA